MYMGTDPWGALSTPPTTFGHETSGIVEMTGENVSTVKPGDRVVVEPMFALPCGHCGQCLAGRTNLCPDRGHWHGRQVGAGGFAEYELVSSRAVVPVPSELPLEVAAMADVYACALHALHTVVPADANQKGAGLAIVGSGPIGMAIGQVARHRGLAPVVMIGRRAAPLRMAQDAGAADSVVLLENGQVHAGDIRGLSGGAQCVIECTNDSTGIAIEAAVGIAAPGARMGLLGAVQTIKIPYSAASDKEITFVVLNSYCSAGGVRELETALTTMAAMGTAPAQLLTHKFHLTDMREAISTVLDRSTTGAVKVLMLP
jgi:threonine dehydrogenase-like Zn-dependent dehydrogenase